MDEEFQLQEILIPKDLNVVRQERESSQREELERYIGIKHEFPDPYHIYLHSKDIGERGEEPLPVIRFIIYSMGKKKVIMTGTYRRYAGGRIPPFRIIYACRYNTRDLMQYVSEWNTRFINTMNVMKDRITNRIQRFIGSMSPPYLRDRNDYVQLKAWLTLQPLSQYYRSDDLPMRERIRSLITPEYMRRLQSSVREFNTIQTLQNELLVSDDESIQNDIQELTVSLIDRLDREMQRYENTISIRSEHSRDKEIVEISRKFATWLETSQYVSDSWVNSLPECKCSNPDDIGCKILSWGEYDPYDLQ